MSTEPTAPAPAAEESRPAATREENRFIAPPVDIHESPDGLTVVADLPGASRESIEISVEKGVLTLKAAARHALPSPEPLHREFALADYFRQFQLGEAVDQERIAAAFKNGVLTLQLPKQAAAKPRRIAVGAA